jgi:hypothetical protein
MVPLFRGPELHGFGFQRAVQIFPSRTAHLFVLHDVFHCRGVSAFRNRTVACDFEDTGHLFSGNRECFGILIDRRNHSVKRDWTRSLLAR